MSTFRNVQQTSRFIRAIWCDRGPRESLRPEDGDTGRGQTCRLVVLVIAATIIWVTSWASGVEVPQMVWTRQFGTTADESAVSIAVDTAGNAYVSGGTTGNLDGPNAGDFDAFVSKYSAEGLLLWTRQLGSSAWDYAYSVAVDSAGNAYICGMTRGDLDGRNAGDSDAFIAKYSTEGSLLWTHQFGTVASEYAYSLSVDGAGNAYICGTTRGDLEKPNAGVEDAFIAKYSEAGSLLWIHQFGTTEQEFARSVSVNRTGSVYISGYSGTIGNFDGFVVKYTDAGEQQWMRQFGTSASDFIWGIAVDGADNAYICGYTYGSLGGPIAGQNDAFVVKYSASGNLLWSRQLGTTVVDGAWSVAADEAGNAYIGGYTYGNLSGPNAGNSDAFVAKYSATGALRWKKQFGTSGTDSAYSTAVDGAGNALVCGATNGNLGGSSFGNRDVFIAKYTSAVFGDVTGDGNVNASDLIAVINAWGLCPTPPTACPADIAPAPNGDGTVGVLDLLMVINSWG